MLELLTAQFGPTEAIRRDIWRKLIWDQDNFVPTEAQAEYLFDPLRVKQVSGGVRAGKSKSVARSCDWFTCIEDGLVWIIGPDYAQTRNEFRYMMAPYRDLGQLNDAKTSMPKEGAWVFEISGGSRVETKSADALEKIAGEAPDAILVVEAGQQDDGILSKVLERGLEKNSYIVFSGTFEGAFSWYSDQWMTWQATNALNARSYSLPTWSNTIIFPDGHDDPRFKEFAEAVPKDIYQERIEAIPFKPSGLVFRESFDETKHIVPLEYNPSLPLEVAMDPATHTYPILFIQWDGDCVFVLDEIYMKNIITQDIIPMAKAHYLWPNVVGGVVDVASRQRQANYSVVDLWARHAGINLRSQKIGIQEGMDAVHLRLKPAANGTPRLLISQDMVKKRRSDKGRANGLLAEFAMYQWGKQHPNSNTKRTPIDANNDAVKALGYWLVDRYGHDIMRDWMMAIETKSMAYPWTQTI